MIRCSLVAGLAVLSLGFAPVPFSRPDPAKAELQKLQGEWIRVRFASTGVPLAEAQPTRMTFAGSQVKYAGSATTDWNVVVNGRTKPKTLDMTGLGGPEKGVTYWGIYLLEDDTLTLFSVKGAGPNRPRDFGPTTEAKVVVEVFKRYKR
jgi:uncharacterized protein (TIGR03067 family)